jgi:phage terminase small subunit
VSKEFTIASVNTYTFTRLESKLMRFTLSIATRAIGHLLHNAEILSKDGAVMVHPNGARQVSAEWTAFKQGFELFLELSKTLGLDPKSRLTLEYFQDGSGDEDDEIAKLLKMN